MCSSAVAYDQIKHSTYLFSVRNVVSVQTLSCDITLERFHSCRLFCNSNEVTILHTRMKLHNRDPFTRDDTVASVCLNVLDHSKVDMFATNMPNSNARHNRTVC